MGIQIKKFQAPTLQQAVEQVRQEMGDNAVILQTEQIKLTGKLGIFGSKGVEVTAAIDRKEMPARFHATVDEAETAVADEKPGTLIKKGFKGLLGGTSSKMKNQRMTPLDQVLSSTVSAEDMKKAVAAKAAKASTASAKATETPASNTGGTTGLLDQNSVNQYYAVKTFVEPLQKELDALKAKLFKTETPAPKKKIKDPLEAEVQSLRQELQGFITEKRFENLKLPTYYRSLMRFWTERGMSNTQILSFFHEMEKFGENFDGSATDQVAAEALSQALGSSIREANVLEKQQKRIVVLVGPTGVGKTTSIVKMAAFEKLKMKRRVAFLTVDDYKVGAIDQLHHYARILEVPFSKVRNDMSLEDQIKHIHADTIFIDTFGVSSKDADRIEALKRLISFKDAELASRIEIHLVLPVGIATTDVSNSLAQFAQLNPHFLLFTKWDETDNWGGMLSTILESKKPVSFICHGQSVPDDMALFSKQSFIETVTGVYPN